MSMHSIVFYCCLCLISQTSSQKTDLYYILCENQRSPILVCPATQIIIIEDAIYGRTDPSVCPHSSIKPEVSYSCKRTDTSRVASNCDYNRACLPQSSNLNDDPCKDTYKYLNVTYTCIEDSCMETSCVKGAYCMHDGERRRCVCPSELTGNDCTDAEDTCMGTSCVNDAYCMHDEYRRTCVCPSELTKNECKYEDISPDYFNRMVSFKTANKTNDLTLLNLKKCVTAEKGSLKFRVQSMDNINITMINSIDKQVVTIEILINKKYITVIYVGFDENGENKTIINKIGVSCNTCSNLAVNWRGDILKLGTMFDDNLVKPVFTGIFKISDIQLSSTMEADWTLQFFESGGPNYVKVEILPNWASSRMLLICQVFQNCNNQLTGEIVPVLFGKANSTCSKEPKIKTWCMNNSNRSELRYSCSDQAKQKNKGCKDILRISACKGENHKCDHCKYHNIEMDIKTLCVDNTERLLVISDRNCTNLHHLLAIWHEIHDEQFESSTQLSTKFFKTSSSSPSTTEQHVSFSTTGLAVGISASVIVIIIISCVLVFLRKKQSSSKKESTQTSPNGQDYIGNQNIAMPWPGDSSEYTDMKVRRESHKYGELKSVNEATGDSCYDVIDANEDQWKKKIFSVEQGIFQNDSSSIRQEYAMLDPNEKWNMESNTSSYHDIAFDDYTVLEAEEGKNNHPVHTPSDQFNKNITKNNETKTEVKSAENATPDNYVVLDPKFTGFNRMNDIGNDKSLEKRALSNPNIREINHKTTHPLKEDTKYYELAKPLDEDGKENTCHKYDGDYGLCQDSDYNKPNGGYPTYSEEHVYNHTVDDVYDTTSHNKKSAVPDNTYDYFSGDKTNDDYNIPMKM